PNSIASWSMTSSSLYFMPSGSSNLNVQPPKSVPSLPPGSSITPSSEMNSVTTILRMSILPCLISMHTLKRRTSPCAFDKQRSGLDAAVRSQHRARDPGAPERHPPHRRQSADPDEDQRQRAQAEPGAGADDGHVPAAHGSTDRPPALERNEPQ